MGDPKRFVARIIPGFGLFVTIERNGQFQIEVNILLPFLGVSIGLGGVQ